MVMDGWQELFLCCVLSTGIEDLKKNERNERTHAGSKVGGGGGGVLFILLFILHFAQRVLQDLLEYHSKYGYGKVGKERLCCTKTA
jgi:hypothetical protein